MHMDPKKTSFPDTLKVFLLSLAGSLSIFLNLKEIPWEKLDTDFPIMSLISCLYKSLDGHSVQALLTLAALFILIRTALSCQSRVYRPALYLSALVLSVLTIPGDISRHDYASHLLRSRVLCVKYLLVFLGYLVLYYFFLILCIVFFKNPDILNPSSPKNPGIRLLRPCRKDIWRTAGFFLLCWLPYLVIFFPGTSGSDAAGQLCQFFGLETYDFVFRSVGTNGTGGLTANQPLLHTLLLGSAAKLGGLLGSQNAGIFLVTLLQSVLTAFAYAFALCYTCALLIPVRLQRIFRFFIALFPLFPLWAVNLSKNSLASPIFLIYLVLLTQFVRTDGQSLSGKGPAAGLWITAFLYILLLKTGFYVLLFTAVIFLFSYRRHWKKILLHLLLPVLLVNTAQNILIDRLNIAKGGPQEMLSLPLQQTVYYLLQYEKETPPEELEIVSRVLDIENAKAAYKSTSADRIKDHYFKKDCSSSELSDYLKVWFRWFLRHPGSYVNSAIRLSHLFFYINADTWFANNSFSTDQLYFRGNDFSDIIKVNSPPALAAARAYLWGLIKIVRFLPGIGLLLNGQIYQLTVIVCILFALLKKRWKTLLITLPVFFNIGLCLLSPVGGHARYMLASVYSAFFILSVLLCPAEEIDRNRKRSA